MAFLLPALGAPALSGESGAASPGPRFVPGLYETESRDSASQRRGTRRTTCVVSADADAFRRDMLARFMKEKQFHAVCKLSAPKLTSDGFAVAMDCGQARSIIAYRFEKDLVRSTVTTQIASRPEYASTILTLSRRIGDCKPAR